MAKKVTKSGKKPVKKSTTKKSVVKTVQKTSKATKKASIKEVAAKKAVTKKPSTRKSTQNKSTGKKSTTKKPMTKKPVANRAQPKSVKASQKSGGTSRRKSTARPASSTDTKRKASRKGRRGELRRHLDERLRILHQRAIVIEEQLKKLDENRFYRTCIFGSARIKQDTPQYAQVFEVARYLAWEGIDVLTGGGPGLMEAANRGALLGREEKQTETLSFGLSIQLEFEPEPNKHLDIKRHHHKFSSRLDDFMRLSHSVVCTPGGIGTLLEFFFVWQLIQVKHATPRPIVLLEKAFWNEILDWMKDEVLDRGLVGEKDFGCIHIVDTPEEVFEIISAHHQEFRARAAAIVEEPS
jgi:uncharacterized protein (TIGR00730 family)